MMDAPHKVVEYINFNFRKVKTKYNDIDDQILTTALAYQYLGLCYLDEWLSIESIRIENQLEI